MIEINGQYVTSEISDIIDELKSQLQLNGVHLFYKTIDTPNNLMICCPFHKEGQERKPSMGIYKKDGTCHCFTCGWVGSIQELVSNCFGYNDMGMYGSKWLIRNFLTLQVEERKDVELDFGRRNNRIVDRSNNNSDSIHYITEDELDKYRYTHPYWAKRGITDETIIELFDLGYDKSTRCITFPVRDIKGNCLFVAKRSVVSKFFHYPEGVVKPLYGLYELSKFWKGEYRVDEIQEEQIHPWVSGGEVIVCESMIDALTCWQYGKYAVALNGLGNELQFKQLRELPCRKLILATDNDEAGMRARQRIAKNVTNKILTQYIIQEGKKDINELTQQEFLSLNETFL